MSIWSAPTVPRAESRRTALPPAIMCLFLMVWPLAAAAQDDGGGLIIAAAQEAPQSRNQIGALRIEGVQRIEPETIRSYLTIQPGDAWDGQKIDAALRRLFATGLFADVNLSRDGDDLVVKVVENPIINSIAFEGNPKITDKDLTGEIQLRPRVVYTRTRVQNDVRRILELYRRQGHFAATVEPKVIQLSENRVDLIFEINEGPSTGVRSINFVGNHQYENNVLGAVIRTKESRWYRSPRTYDPDLVTYDRELLRKFYLSEGYADFRVVSVVAELTPDRDGFILTYTIEEGERYHFGKLDVDIQLKDLLPESVTPLLTVQGGDWYNAEGVERLIAVLTDALGNRGYAFVDVKPDITRNKDEHTLDVVFRVREGPQVYVERIDVNGNVRTLDKVIRREFRLIEGDAFNTSRMRRSKERIKNLGFFKRVEVGNQPGSAPDRTVITVDVEEQSTGEFSLGAGYELGKGLLASFGVGERNFLGRGQAATANIKFSVTGTKMEMSFTDPYVADRNLRGKWGVEFSTGASYDLVTLVAGFQITMWVGVLVFRMPVVLLFFLQGAYYSYLWSHDQSRCRRQFHRTMKACKATILLQISYFIIANVIQLLNLGVTRFVDV